MASVFAIPSISLASIANCQFNYGSSSDVLYVDSSNKAFYVTTERNSRYGDTETVYDATTCKKITSGSADKSNFTAVMDKNNFEPVSINVSANNGQYINRSFTQYVKTSKNGKKINITIQPLTTEQKSAVQALDQYIKSPTTINRSVISKLQSDNLLQKLLTLDNYSSEKYNFALMLATNNYEKAKPLAKTAYVKGLLKDNAQLQKTYDNLVINKGDFTEVMAFAKKGDKNALQMAFNKATTDDEYRQAELMLINKIKDKLISVTANISGSKVEKKTWNESRIFGRTTDEGAVYVTNNVSFNTKLDSNLYSPKNTFKIKAKLVADISYSKGKNRSVNVELVSQLGNGKNSSNGSTTIKWLSARTGAGSFMTQNYIVDDYSFTITDISVE